MTPDREKTLRFVRAFTVEEWNIKLLAFIGPGANTMISGEKKEGKYSRDRQGRRQEDIIQYAGHFKDGQYDGYGIFFTSGNRDMSTMHLYTPTEKLKEFYEIWLNCAIFEGGIPGWCSKKDAEINTKLMP